MPPFAPISRGDLIRLFKQLGFAGPYSGGKHQFMVRGSATARIPNPHQGSSGKELLIRILRQAEITRDEWERV
ncbi:MAG TPA: type II toxin-antitoxin system HicA family toxin [Armatimonadota bacterium]|nr:type II toxin-antitoxin system HicA family toxin [Armatimonadota bacterium]HOS43723.1 type II toxin-antitoxin system HicA family toxin [Armatimonadota bacterium]